MLELCGAEDLTCLAARSVPEHNDAGLPVDLKRALYPRNVGAVHKDIAVSPQCCQRSIVARDGPDVAHIESNAVVHQS